MIKQYIQKVFISGFLFPAVLSGVFLENSRVYSMDLGQNAVNLATSTPSEYIEASVPENAEIGANLNFESKPIPLTKSEIKKIIWKYAEREGVNWRLALDLATYESQLNPDAVNIYPNEFGTSTAGGLYMFVDNTWDRICQYEFGLEDKFDPYDNAECAMILLGAGGIGHWTSDKNTCAYLQERGHISEDVDCSKSRK